MQRTDCTTRRVIQVSQSRRMVAGSGLHKAGGSYYIQARGASYDVDGSVRAWSCGYFDFPYGQRRRGVDVRGATDVCMTSWVG